MVSVARLQGKNFAVFSDMRSYKLEPENPNSGKCSKNFLLWKCGAEKDETQWWIQDFPKGGGANSVGGAKVWFGDIAEN